MIFHIFRIVIQEGDDVYFECRIVSNPEATKLEWYHEASWSINCVLCDISLGLSLCQEEQLLPNAPGGILLSNQSLVIQVPRFKGEAGMVTEYLDI